MSVFFMAKETDNGMNLQESVAGLQVVCQRQRNVHNRDSEFQM